MKLRSTSRPGRAAFLRGVAAAAVAVGALIGSDSPAGADPPVTSFTTPSDEEVFAVASPEISGEVRMINGVLLEDLRVEVVSKWDRPGASTIVPATALSAKAFSFTPTLAYNGPYQVFVTATGKDLSLDIRTDTAVTTRSFSLAVPPAVPTGVEAMFDPETRATTVRWEPNPEPDIIGYEVRRSAPSDAREKVIGVTAETSVVDRDTASKGGELSYQVTAVRVGSSADSGVVSEPSAPTAVSVPPRPPGQASPTAGASSAAGSQQGSTVDIPQFRAQVREATRRNGDQDSIFDPVLPTSSSGSFDPVPEPPDLSDAELGTAVGEPREAGEPANERSLYFVAAGLLATVVVAQLRWVIRVADRSPPIPG